MVYFYEICESTNAPRSALVALPIKIPPKKPLAPGRQTDEVRSQAGPARRCPHPGRTEYREAHAILIDHCGTNSSRAKDAAWNIPNGTHSTFTPPSVRSFLMRSAPNGFVV